MSNVLFTDQARTSIDEKGRTSFPREFRRQLPDDESRRLVITLGPSRTLNLYTRADFREYASKLISRPNTPQNSIFRQQVLGNALEVELDGQNRIMLNKTLMSYASLVNEVVFVGDGQKIVLYSPEAFEQSIGFTKPDDFANFDKAFFDFSSDGVGADG